MRNDKQEFATLNRLTNTLCKHNKRKFKRGKATQAADNFKSCNPHMAHKNTQKITVKMGQAHIPKLNGGHPRRMNDTVITNAKHIPKSPKLTTIAKSMKATNFNDEGRDNK
jgi:hypothetical protein